MKSRYFAFFGVWALFIAVATALVSQNRATKKKFTDFRAETVTILKTALFPEKDGPTEEEVVSEYLDRIATRVEIHSRIAQDMGAIAQELSVRRNGERRDNREDPREPSPLKYLDTLPFLDYRMDQERYTRVQYSKSLYLLSLKKPPLSMRPLHAALAACWLERRTTIKNIQDNTDRIFSAIERGDKTYADIYWNELQDLRNSVTSTKADRAQKELDALRKIYPKLPERIKNLRLSIPLETPPAPEPVESSDLKLCLWN